MDLIDSVIHTQFLNIDIYYVRRQNEFPSLLFIIKMQKDISDLWI